MPLRLELIAVVGVVDLFRREVLEMHRLAAEYGPTPVATNISHDSSSARLAGVFGGRNLPVFSAR